MPDPDSMEGEAGREGGDDPIEIPILTPTTVGILVRFFQWAWRKR